LLDPKSLSAAKRGALALKSAEARVPALLSIGLALEGPEKAAALNAALKSAVAIASPAAKAAAVMQLVKHLGGRVRDRALRTALGAAKRIEGAQERLVALAMHLEYRSGATATSQMRHSPRLTVFPKRAFPTAGYKLSLRWRRI
jgi:hypothetical protein